MKSRIPLPTIAAVILILVAVLLPGSTLSDVPGIPGLDKLAHLVLFLMLAVALHLDFNLSDGRRIGIATVAVLAFAALTETLQLMVEGRSAEFSDMVADMSGFVIGLMLRQPLAALVGRISAAWKHR